MARFNEILVGRYNRFLQKFLSMKGGPPAPQLASEMIAAWSLFHGAENRYLEAWDRFGAVVTRGAGGVSNSNLIRLRNPAGSNLVVVFEKISVCFTLADQAQFSVRRGQVDAATALGNIGNPQDNRGRAASTVIASAGTTLSGGVFNAFAQVDFAANSTADFIVTDIQEVTVLPGDVLDVGQIATNQAMTASFMWRERFLEDSERS